MSIRRHGRGRGRGRTGTVTPAPIGIDPVDFMAAMENMAAAMQATAEALGNQINQGNHGNNNDEDGPMTLAMFLKAQQVPEEQWVEFETYQLQGEAQYWWQGTRRILQPDGAAIPWEVFRAEFYMKYFPNLARNAKELELMQLKQGQMTVAEVFSELVNKSRVAEDCVRKAAVEKGSLKVPFQRPSGRSIAPRGRNFNRGGFVPQQTQGQDNYRRPNTNVNQGRRFGKQPQQDLNCQRCGRNHPGIPCRVGLGVCYSCGQPGHMATNCPEKKKYETGRVQQPGRVYTTSTIGAEGSETLIRDWLSKNHVLLDCSEKSVQFMPEGSEAPVVVNSYYLNSMIVNCSRAECHGIMLLTTGVSCDDKSLEQIPIVCEFSDVFPDDINEFPPNREVEFAIELVPGSGPISITPYRM
ncbi:uncharacterized protein LOC130975714 [Arachis stenosperma]|uniref:uncharacterized protein LOC130975714 n=1 Tax=Arachis stenosperma TaxID=217475 RepID=UPI0025AB89A0|nr:uncharacterized protein LOC130975714 [Arachis stenosperma]